MFKEAIILLVALLFFCVNSQTYPNTNCPVFRYDTQNGFTVGRVEVPNDFSGDYRISINMTVAAYLTQNENIQIQRQTEASDIRNGFPLVYFIIFPIQNVRLKPTRIEFNGQIYCTGPQEQPRPGQGVTNFWATDYLGTGGVVPRPPVQPPPIFNIQPPTTERNPPISFITETPFVATPIFTQTITRPTVTQRRPTVTQRRPTVTQRRPIVTQTTPSIIPSSRECGLVTNTPASIPLIANGTDVIDKQYPWMGAIMYKIEGSPSQQHVYHCTCSLVSPKHIITAGHCIKDKKALLVKKEDILIIFGITDISDWVSSSDLTTATVSDILVHPEYNSTNGDSDVAVFTLNERIRITDYVRPICIWNEDEDLRLIEGQRGTVAGWGSDRVENAMKPIAAYVDMPVVSQVTCLRSNPKYRKRTSIRTFCAGNRDGSGPCNGDSGGPFMMNRNGRWTLRGVVSSSLSDDLNLCDLNNYFIFADIAKSRDWLNTVLI